ncbi:hypothetical protein GCM10028778_22650 [Barrientosiimonas marina]|uniref:DUF1722 domain-containing protein n=1 Tax=Lentibacillus kimchii TaxID=1542911 RepID=A0ABW2UW38_9BACI
MKLDQIDDKKLVLKAAQSVWAANKYFVLACDQTAYRDVRQLLRPDTQRLNEAYTLLQRIDATYQSTASEALPELANALYHAAGYFKQLLSNERRQAINALIRDQPAAALAELERETTNYHVDYLLSSRLWPSQREKPFNHVPVRLTYQGQVYEASELLWQGDHVIRRT